MSSCNHVNVVTYFTSFVHKEELWLVLRLLDSGSLLDIIRHKMKTQDCKHGVLDEVTIATVLREVLKGLEYLHNTGHIHRSVQYVLSNLAIQITLLPCSDDKTIGGKAREKYLVLNETLDILNGTICNAYFHAIQRHQGRQHSVGLRRSSPDR